MFKNKQERLFKTVDELKAFIKWCKSEHLNNVTVEGVSFQFSDTRILTAESMSNLDNAMINSSKPDQIQSDSKTDEELLYWSAQNS